MAKGSGGVRNNGNNNAKERILQLESDGWNVEIKNDSIRDFNAMNLGKFDYEKYKKEVSHYLTDVLGMGDLEFTFYMDDKFADISFENDNISCYRSFALVDGENGTELVAQNSVLSIDKKFQRKNISPLIYGMNMDDYKRMGVSKVKMVANEDWGGFVWSKYGFTADRTQVLGIIRDRFKGNRKTKAQTIIDDYYKSHSKDKRFPMNLLSDFKNELAGSRWSGEIDLNDATQMKVYNDYVAKKSRK